MSHGTDPFFVLCRYKCLLRELYIVRHLFLLLVLINRSTKTSNTVTSLQRVGNIAGRAALEVALYCTTPKVGEGQALDRT